MEDASARELKEALRDNFAKRGVLGQLEAQIRGQVLESLGGMVV